MLPISNEGAKFKTEFGALIAQFSSACTGDAAGTTCACIDRVNYQSMKLSALLGLSLTTAKTLTIDCDIYSSDDATGVTTAFTKYITAFDSVVITATGNSVKEADIDLTGAGRYIYALFTPDLSQTTEADTASIGIAYNLCGSVLLPLT